MSAAEPATPPNDGVSRTTSLPVLALAAALLLSWSVYALGIRPHVPTQSVALETFLSVVARAIFWGIPCVVYLKWFWGRLWYRPLGLDFPLGAPQIALTLVTTVLVTLVLFVGTAIQLDIRLLDLVAWFLDRARFDLVAPLSEELVFRGLILGELINWVRDSSSSPRQVRRRFWGVLLLSSAIFTLIHWPWWLAHFGPMATLERSGPVFFTGLVLGFVFAHTRSIWACVFLHWLNNTLSLST